MSPIHASITERTAQLESLRNRAAIRLGLSELESQLRRTHLLESELAQFASAYFDALGDDMALLASSSRAKHEATMVASLANQPARSKQAIKQSYRRIVKVLHPDSAAPATENNAWHAAQSAYKAHDLASLVCLEIALAPPPLDAPQATLAGLEAKLGHIHLALADAEARYSALKQSTLYVCWQRAQSDKLAGRNWITAITERLKAELQQQKRAWLASGLAHLPS